jgi:crossover junction endodeoxyribonuclease RuvC
MRILGIDPGYDRVGVAIVDKVQGVETLLFSDCIVTNRQFEISARIYTVGQAIEQIIREYTPDILAIEALLFNTNQKTAMRVAEARGVMLYIASAYELGIHEYTPSQIKIALTGHGSAPKDQVASMVRNITKMTKEVKFDDEMDAVAVALTGSASIRSLE